jgi:hypothetical protein
VQQVDGLLVTKDPLFAIKLHGFRWHLDWNSLAGSSKNLEYLSKPLAGFRLLKSVTAFGRRGGTHVNRIAYLVAAGLLQSLPAAAHTPQQPPHQLYSEGNLKLESGEAIEDFSISYVTHGTLNAKKSNAILMVTAISGNHHRLDFMIGPGRRSTPRNISSSAPMRSPTASRRRRAIRRRSRA